jgi:hypothetical protein
VDLLDLVLVLVIVGYAVSGYRRGLVAGCVSLAGFVGGAAVGVWLLPWVTGQVARGTAAATALAVATVLVPAVVGHELAGRLALRLRGELDRGPLRVADGMGGAAANTVAVLLVAWVAASVLSAAPSQPLTTAIRNSTLLGAVQRAMPEATPAWFARATSGHHVRVGHHPLRRVHEPAALAPLHARVVRTGHVRADRGGLPAGVQPVRERVDGPGAPADR